MERKIQIVDCSGGELIVNTEQLQNLMQEQISNGFGDYPAAFLGFLGSPQSGKSFTASLVHKQCSSDESNIAVSVTTALKQTKSPQEANVTSGITLWKQPVLVTIDNDPIHIWLVEFNCAGDETYLNSPLIQLAKLICSRIVELVLDANTILISPDIFLHEGLSSLGYFCWSILYLTRNPINNMESLQEIVYNLTNYFGIPTEISEMTLVNGEKLNEVDSKSLEKIIAEIVHNHDISQAAHASLNALVDHLTNCCANLNTLFREMANNPAEFHKQITSHAEIDESDEQNESSDDDEEDVFIEVAMAFYKKGIDSQLIDKREHFSNKQMFKMHFILSTKIYRACTTAVGENFDSGHLQRKLDTCFEQCKQRNIRNLKGKAKQVENIVQKLKNAYNKKMEELNKSPKPPMRESPGSQLERILKVELWTKVGPTEPLQAHWDCLRSQVNLEYTFQKQTEKRQLGIQLNYGTLSMGIWKEGKCLHLKNEHGEEATSTIVGVTKARTLVYGSQVKRAEMRGNILHKYHIGEHFEPTGDSPRKKTRKYELPLKNEVRQVGISIFLGFLFKKMKISAERQLEIEMQNCVITVPYYYAHYQRLEIKFSAIAAGFREVRVLSDASAAAFHFAFFKIQKSGSPLRTFRVLSENNGNFYGAVYRFYKEKRSLRMMVHMKRSFKDNPSSDVLTDEEKVRIAFAELTSQYNRTYELKEWERLNDYGLAYSEHPRWKPILESAWKQMGAEGIITSPIHDAIDLLTKFRDQIKESLPHQIFSRTGAASESTDQTCLKISSTKTELFQKLYGTEIYPFGTLRIRNFTSKARYTLSASLDGGITLQKSTSTEGPIRKLRRGSHFIWEPSGKNLKREVPEVAPLIERFFSRSIEEVKKREEKSNESKIEERNKKKEEIPKIKAKLVGRCRDMRSMIRANQVQISDLIKPLIENVIKGSENLAKKPNCTLEAVTAQLASLEKYYEKYFVRV